MQKRNIEINSNTSDDEYPGKSTPDDSYMYTGLDDYSETGMGTGSTVKEKSKKAAAACCLRL